MQLKARDKPSREIVGEAERMWENDAPENVGELWEKVGELVRRGLCSNGEHKAKRIAV